MADVLEELKILAAIDLFKEGRTADSFVGRPFYFDYTRVKVLVNDKWKNRVGGIPAGSFLLCAYDSEPDVQAMILLRVLGPTALPTDSEVIASMVDSYKEEVPPGGKQSKLDSFTRYEFMFSGLECRVLGTFYRDGTGKTLFGADVENFYSAHNYSVYKPVGRVLEYIVNFREGTGIPGGKDEVRLGEVRYSASRLNDSAKPAPVYVSALDFVGKRTALFGMTRTGKSNTLKKIVESTVEISAKKTHLGAEDLKPVGQIIFDVNGEYANANQQDEGTAVFELFEALTTRYSLLEKEGFKVMKLNFHADIEAGFGLLQSFLGEGASDYVGSFLSIDFGAYATDEFFTKYPGKHGGREWADEDLKAVLVMLTRKKTSGGAAGVSGFRKLQPFKAYHTDSTEESFERDIITELREGRIVIVDLSQGDPTVQATYSERICRKVFNDSMGRFIANEPANYIQMYFEEAHNLFPKKTEADLSQIYNRIAKEGAKLRLGLIYATQEVSSISANVLKNTQNWFVSHLNNQEELKEIGKYYDFEDFVDSLRAAADRGFIRMKTYSNAFTVPVQIDRFLANRGRH